MGKITGEEVKEYLAKGGKFMWDILVKAYGEKMNEVGEEAFAEAIEIGVSNTITALYDAGIDDEKILDLINKHWGIPRDEATNRLVWTKKEMVKSMFHNYLKLQGKTEKEIQHFWIQNKIGMKLKENPELWKLKDKPEKLLKAVCEEKN